MAYIYNIIITSNLPVISHDKMGGGGGGGGLDQTGN